MGTLKEYLAKTIDMAIVYLPKLLLAIIVLVVGLRIIKLVTRGLDRALNKTKTDQTLHKFLMSLVGILLKVLLFISVASMVGIATTSFVALLGAAGLAIGLALQGSLANFAGGVLILFFKPFKVGDFIEAQGFSGTVSQIQIFSTVLKTPDNKTIIIPNGGLAGGSMINFSSEPTRRIDMTFGIGYGDDIRQAKALLHKIVKEETRILTEPEALVVVTELADSSVNIAVRVWCKKEDYWSIFHAMQEKVKESFDQAGISIPFPQQDIHLFQKKAESQDPPRDQ